MGSPSRIGWALVAALGLVACPRPCPAQNRLGGPPGPPPSGPPVPVAIGADAPPPPPGPVPPPDAAPCPCPPAWSGWYAGADVTALWPSVHLNFTGNGRLDLDATASPRAWLGYQFEQGGSVRLTYRNLSSSGNFLFALPDGGGSQEVDVDLDAHWVDLDYVSRDYVWCGSGRFAWELGGRFTSRDLDAKAADFSGLFAVKTSYLGGGPHFGLDTAWLFGDSGLALFARFDGAVTFGEDRSRPGIQTPGPFAIDLSLPSQHRSEVEGDLVVQLGVSWTRSYPTSWLHVAGGVQAEGWAFRHEDPPLFPSHGVASIGPFLGVEVGY